MLKIFSKFMDKAVKSNLDDSLKKLEELPEECKVIVAEIFQERYQKTSLIMASGNKLALTKNLYTEAIDAGKRSEKYKFELNRKKSWFLICHLAEAEFCVSAYQCLQLENTPEFVQYGVDTIEKFISINIPKKILLKDKIEKIMGSS